MFLMTFFGFLRCSEIAITSKFNPKLHPTISDLSIIDSETIAYFIKQSKTDQERKGHFIYIYIPLRTLWEPSIRGIKPRLIFSRKGDSPFRCSRAAAPFGRSESPSISRVSLLIQRRTGLPFRCSRPTAPFSRSVTPPSVTSSCATCSVADGALTPGAAESRAPFGRCGSPPSEASNHASYSASRGTLPSSAAEPQLPSDAVRVPPSVASLCLFSVGRGSPSGAADPRLPSVAVWPLRLSFRVALCARWRTGLSIPVQQSRPLAPFGCNGSSSSDASNRALYSAARGTLPSGAAEPQLPSDAVRVPPSVVSLCLFGIKRVSPLRCSRPTAPFGRRVSPPSVVWVALRARRQTRLSLSSRAAGSLRLRGSPPSDASNRASNLLAYSASDGALPSGKAEPQLPSVAVWALRLSLQLCCVLGDGRGSPSRCSRAAGSLQSQWEPSIRHVKPCLVFSCKRDSPFRCSRAAAPFGRSESPSFDICHRAPLLAACRARQSDTASRSSRWALHELTGRPASFSFANFNPYLSTACIFRGATNIFALWLLSHAFKLLLGSSLGSGHIPGLEPSPRTASQNMLTICYQIRCKGELVNQYLWHLTLCLFKNIPKLLRWKFWKFIPHSGWSKREIKCRYVMRPNSKTWLKL